MARASRARQEAAQILGDIRRRNARAREVLRSNKRLAALDARDRALVSRLVLGAVGSVGLLDSMLNAYLRKGTHLEPKVRDALRISTFELLFLSTPSSVAVSQGVELARYVSPRASGLANAVLRRIADKDVERRRMALERVKNGEEQEGDLELVSGYPSWLLQRVRHDRGIDAARNLAMSATEPAPIYVGTNEALVSMDEARDLLEEAGLHPQKTPITGAFVLREPAGLFTSGLVQDAKVVVADLNAQRVAQRMVTSEGANLLEVGQGRGTKSILMCSEAMRLGHELSIVGLDSEAFKVKVAQDRMVRAGLGNVVRCVEADARLLLYEDQVNQVEREYGVVFVDAPCSGVGTLRRHPEIVWTITKKDVQELSKLQLEILSASSTRVRMGGMLGYATCSVFEEENEGVINAFLASPQGSSFELVEKPFVSLPARDAPDGHFCACMHHVT